MLAYNDTLNHLGDCVKALGAREGLPVADVFTPMLSVTRQGKADDPKFTIIPDGVHPDRASAAPSWGMPYFQSGWATPARWRA